MINDINDFVINFYRVLKTRFDELKLEVECSLSSRSIHRKAGYIFRNAASYDEVKLAWACWYLCNSSFIGKITGGWKYDKTENKDCQVLMNRKSNFSRALVKRIELTQIECDDAIKIILSRDLEHSFFYIDPPYIDTDQGHYAGYTLEDFTRLLNTLAAIKGKFMLSGFNSAILSDFITRYGWVIKTFQKASPAQCSYVKDKRIRGKKTEVLVMNYNIEAKQMSAF